MWTNQIPLVRSCSYNTCRLWRDHFQRQIAAGGLGLMAIQIAKTTGARVITTASAEEKLFIARKFGADERVNYSHCGRRFWILLRKLEWILYDPVDLVDKSLKCLKHKSRILVIEFSVTKDMIEKIAMNKFYWSRLRSLATLVHSLPVLRDADGYSVMGKAIEDT